MIWGVLKRVVERNTNTSNSVRSRVLRPWYASLNNIKFADMQQQSVTTLHGATDTVHYSAKAHHAYA